jgi:hypothetical protein
MHYVPLHAGQDANVSSPLSQSNQLPCNENIRAPGGRKLARNGTGPGTLASPGIPLACQNNIMLPQMGHAQASLASSWHKAASWSPGVGLSALPPCKLQNSGTTGSRVYGWSTMAHAANPPLTRQPRVILYLLFICNGMSWPNGQGIGLAIFRSPVQTLEGLPYPAW